MKKIKYALVFTFVILPLFSLIYKNQFLNMSLLPKAPTDSWILELAVNKENESLTSERNLNSFKLPIPSSGGSQKVTYLKISPKKRYSKINQNSVKALSLKAHLKLYGQSEIPPPREKELTKTKFSKYTKLPELEEDVKNQLFDISESIVFSSDSSLKKLIEDKCEDDDWWSYEEIQKMLVDVLSGLEHLHLNQVAHRDLKVIEQKKKT